MKTAVVTFLKGVPAITRTVVDQELCGQDGRIAAPQVVYGYIGFVYLVAAMTEKLEITPSILTTDPVHRYREDAIQSKKLPQDSSTL